jgi:dihydrolipoamide dehydrogenase
VIGVEFASVWRSFGAEVTIVEALDHLVPNEDIALSKGLERAFRKRGITAKLGVRFAGVTQTDAGVEVSLEDGTALGADYLLVAVGRGPATDGLGFEEAGVTIDRGFVTVDERLATSAPHVYAVGDIVPGLQLAHRASSRASSWPSRSRAPPDRGS